MPQPLSRRLRMAGVTLLGALVMTACGHSTEPGATRTAPPADAAAATFNDADVTFAQQMIPHHQQAVAMVNLAGTRAADFELQQLAAFIKEEQQPEIDLLNRWLTSWGKPTPTASAGGHTMQTMSDHMPGMMSAQDMARLQAAKGSAFDKQFVTMMIDHHNGAIQMARQELAAGLSSDAKALAEQVILTQETEVKALRGIASRL